MFHRTSLTLQGSCEVQDSPDLRHNVATPMIIQPPPTNSCLPLVMLDLEVPHLLVPSSHPTHGSSLDYEHRLQVPCGHYCCLVPFLHPYQPVLFFPLHHSISIPLPSLFSSPSVFLKISILFLQISHPDIHCLLFHTI